MSISDSDVSLSFSESIKGNEEIACRESLRNLAGNIELSQANIRANKNNIKSVEHCIRDSMENVRKVELAIKDKQELLARIENESKTLKNKIDDVDLEIEELFVFGDQDVNKAKLTQLEESFNDKAKICLKLKADLESLKEKIKTSETSSAAKMKELKNLNEFLHTVKAEVQKAHKQVNKLPARPTSSKPSQVSSEIGEDIKKKIKQTISQVITSDEAEEILGRIKNSIRTANMRSSITENKMIELKRDFEEKKFQLLVEGKMKREKIVRGIKENNERIVGKFYEDCRILKDELKEDLKIAREAQYRFPFSGGEFERVFQKFCVIGM